MQPTGRVMGVCRAMSRAWEPGWGPTGAGEAGAWASSGHGWWEGPGGKPAARQEAEGPRECENGLQMVGSEATATGPRKPPAEAVSFASGEVDWVGVLASPLLEQLCRRLS